MSTIILTSSKPQSRLGIYLEKIYTILMRRGSNSVVDTKIPELSIFSTGRTESLFTQI